MSIHHAGPAAERRALDAYVKLARAATAVEARINRHLGDAGLTLSQFGVLEALYHLGPLNPGQLAEKILKSGGNLTLVIDNLVKRGLVDRSRDSADRRYVTVRLTDTGRSTIDGLFPTHVGRVVDAFAVLDDAEQDTLAALCRKLGLAQRPPPARTGRGDTP